MSGRPASEPLPFSPFRKGNHLRRQVPCGLYGSRTSDCSWRCWGDRQELHACSHDGYRRRSPLSRGRLILKQIRLYIGILSGVAAVELWIASKLHGLSAVVSLLAIAINVLLGALCLTRQRTTQVAVALVSVALCICLMVVAFMSYRQDSSWVIVSYIAMLCTVGVSECLAHRVDSQST